LALAQCHYRGERQPAIEQCGVRELAITRPGNELLQHNLALFNHSASFLITRNQLRVISDNPGFLVSKSTWFTFGGWFQNHRETEITRRELFHTMGIRRARMGNAQGPGKRVGETLVIRPFQLFPRWRCQYERPG